MDPFVHIDLGPPLPDDVAAASGPSFAAEVALDGPPGFHDSDAAAPDTYESRDEDACGGSRRGFRGQHRRGTQKAV